MIRKKLSTHDRGDGIMTPVSMWFQVSVISNDDPGAVYILLSIFTFLKLAQILSSLIIVSLLLPDIVKDLWIP